MTDIDKLILAGAVLAVALIFLIDTWVRTIVRAYDRRTDKIRITVEQRR